jgi:hypothetical protein
MNNGCDKFYIHLTLATVIMRLYLGHRKQNGAKVMTVTQVLVTDQRFTGRVDGVVHSSHGHFFNPDIHIY